MHQPKRTTPYTPEENRQSAEIEQRVHEQATDPLLGPRPTAKPTKNGGLDIEANGRVVMTIEPIGYPEQPPVGSESEGQHYITTALEGPDKGQQTRLV